MSAKELIQLGMKSSVHPHGYGYCQCGCGMKTIMLRSGKYANYQAEHHPLAIERKKRQGTTEHCEIRQAKVHIRLEKTQEINKTNPLNQSNEKSFGLNIESEKLIDMYFEEKKENINLHKVLEQAISTLVLATDYIDSFCPSENNGKPLILNLLRNEIKKIAGSTGNL